MPAKWVIIYTTVDYEELLDVIGFVSTFLLYSVHHLYTRVPCHYTYVRAITTQYTHVCAITTQYAHVCAITKQYTHVYDITTQYSHLRACISTNHSLYLFYLIYPIS